MQRTFKAMVLLAGGMFPWAAAIAKPDEKKTVSRLAFGSCCQQNDPQPIWNTIAAAEPDLFLFIGDNIYADTENMNEMAAKYKKLGAKPEFSAFRSKVPLLATWDDHDYGINDGGAEYPKKEQSKKLLLDFFNEPVDSQRRRQQGIYTSYCFGPPGKRLQVILLDLRWFRSKLNINIDEFAYGPNTEPNATLLGDAQWRWLEGELKKPADLRLIASSIQFASPEHPWEKWANFPKDKARIMHLIDDYKLKNVFFISGDMHFGELSREKTPAGYEVFDLTSSGMNFFENGTQYKNKNRISLFDKAPNFGFIEIDWKPNAPKVSLQVRTDKGATPIEKVVTFHC